MNNWRSWRDAKKTEEFFKALCKGYGKEDTSEITSAYVAAVVSIYQDFLENRVISWRDRNQCTEVATTEPETGKQRELLKIRGLLENHELRVLSQVSYSAWPRSLRCY